MSLSLKSKIFRQRWVKPIINPRRILRAVKLYRHYLSDWRSYSQFPSPEPLCFINSYPCLFDRTTTTPFDSHYFYQDIWAFKRIQASGTPNHVDVGSRAILLAC